MPCNKQGCPSLLIIESFALLEYKQKEPGTWLRQSACPDYVILEFDPQNYKKNSLHLLPVIKEVSSKLELGGNSNLPEHVNKLP